MRSSDSLTILRGMQATSLMTLPVQVPRWRSIFRTRDSSSARGSPLSSRVSGSGGIESVVVSLARVGVDSPRSVGAGAGGAKACAPSGPTAPRFILFAGSTSIAVIQRVEPGAFALADIPPQRDTARKAGCPIDGADFTVGI